MTPAAAADAVVGERWTAKAGAWLGIGASPAALVLGAGIAARHDGPAPVVGILVGAALMAVLLASQGMLGLAPPAGENATLSALAPSYLRRRSHQALNALLAAAMIGWFGFNVGLGGAALAALLGLPGPAGPALLGLPIVALSFAGMRAWNPLAVVTTASALVLVGLVTLRLAAPAAPVSLDLRATGSLADIAGFVGYAAVFALRAPDFSVGLRRRSDLAWCVGLLVVPTTAVVLAGIGLQRGTGSTDLVGALAGSGGLAAGNLLVALAVIAAAFTTTYSGSLALRAVTRLTSRQAMLAVALPGLVLAALRFDRHLVPWLALLAAVLPPLVVPMAFEGARRRRGHAPRLVPLWTWAPGSAGAAVLTVAGRPVAALAGLAIATVCTAVWHVRTAERTREGDPS